MECNLSFFQEIEPEWLFLRMLNSNWLLLVLKDELEIGFLRFLSFHFPLNHKNSIWLFGIFSRYSIVHYHLHVIFLHWFKKLYEILNCWYSILFLLWSYFWDLFLKAKNNLKNFQLEMKTNLQRTLLNFYLL